MNNSLFDRVIELCKEKGISQRQLQRDLGMSTGALAKWRTSTPSTALLQNAADYLGVTVDYLTGRSPYRNRDHMFQVWDDKYGHNLFNAILPDGTIVEYNLDGTLTLHTETDSVDYMYLDPELRDVALIIKNNPNIKAIFDVLKDAPEDKVNLYKQLICGTK